MGKKAGEINIVTIVSMNGLRLDSFFLPIQLLSGNEQHRQSLFSCYYLIGLYFSCGHVISTLLDDKLVPPEKLMRK